jgi:hypothetical protein
VKAPGRKCPVADKHFSARCVGTCADPEWHGQECPARLGPHWVIIDDTHTLQGKPSIAQLNSCDSWSKPRSTKSPIVTQRERGWLLDRARPFVMSDGVALSFRHPGLGVDHRRATTGRDGAGHFAPGASNWLPENETTAAGGRSLRPVTPRDPLRVRHFRPSAIRSLERYGVAAILIGVLDRRRQAPRTGEEAAAFFTCLPRSSNRSYAALSIVWSR